MGLVDAIAAIRNRRDLHEDDQRKEIYALKVNALIDVINGEGFLGKNLTHKGVQFRINKAEITPQPALALDVTFTKPPANPVTHQITIVNPPVLPANQTGDERQDLIMAIHEMLEGFV